MHRGQGWKSRVVGTIVILCVVFAVGDYYASIVSVHPSIALDEALAVQRLRILLTAETNFAKVGSTSEPVYGTVADLSEASLIDSSFKGRQVQMGNRSPLRPETGSKMRWQTESGTTARCQSAAMNWLRRDKIIAAVSRGL
jgi:hypothetical protein